MEGWIRIHRQIAESPDWLSEPFSRGQAWVDLLIITNHSDGYIRVAGERIEVKRGQCGWSQLNLSKRWDWSRDKLRKWLNELEKDGRITKKKGNRNTIITICNYSKYQSYSTTDKATDKATEKHQIEQQKNIRQGTNNNDNNDNNEIEECYAREDFSKNKKTDHEKIIEHALENGFEHLAGKNLSPIATSISKGVLFIDWQNAMEGCNNKQSIGSWNYLAKIAEQNASNRLNGLPPPTTTSKPKLPPWEQSAIDGQNIALRILEKLNAKDNQND